MASFQWDPASLQATLNDPELLFSAFKLADSGARGRERGPDPRASATTTADSFANAELSQRPSSLPSARRLISRGWRRRPRRGSSPPTDRRHRRLRASRRVASRRLIPSHPIPSHPIPSHLIPLVPPRQTAPGKSPARRRGGVLRRQRLAEARAERHLARRHGRRGDDGAAGVPRGARHGPGRARARRRGDRARAAAAASRRRRRRSFKNTRATSRRWTRPGEARSRARPR